MLRYSFLVVLFAVWAGGSAAQDDANKDDLKKMQGKWKVVLIVQDGALVETYGNEFFTFDKNTIAISGSTARFVFTMDAAKKPRAMDLFPLGEESKARKAIYAIDFGGKRLRICLPSDYKKDRPDEFDSKTGSGWRLVTLAPAKS